MQAPNTAPLINLLLPAEIHSHIFRELRDSYVHHRPYHWLAISHVCQSWRRIALGDSELWTQMRTLNVEAIQTFLERSGQRPLDFQFGGCFEDREQVPVVLQLLLSQFPRFRVFILEGVSLGPVFEHSFPQGAPSILEHLHFLHNAGRFLGEPGRPSLFETTLPCLQSLTLSCWQGWSLKTLSAPRLRSLSVFLPRLLSVNDWILVLREMPQLEFIELENAVLPDPGDAHVQDHLDMPHLRDMRFRTTDVYDALGERQLLARLRPPADRDIYLQFHCAIQAASVDARRDIVKIIGEKFTVMSRRRQSPERIRIVEDPEGEFYVNLWEQPTLRRECPLQSTTNVSGRELGMFGHDVDDQYEGPCILDLLFYLNRTQEMWAYTAVATMLCESFTFSNAKSLELVDLSEAYEHEDPRELVSHRLDSMQDALCQMTNLCQLSVAGTYVEDYLEALLLGIPSHSSDTEEPFLAHGESDEAFSILSVPPFPWMESVSIYSTRSPYKIDSKTVLHAMKVRKEWGYLVGKLHICSRTGSSLRFVLDRLRHEFDTVLFEMVTCTDWDENGQYLEDERDEDEDEDDDRNEDGQYLEDEEDEDEEDEDEKDGDDNWNEEDEDEDRDEEDEYEDMDVDVDMDVNADVDVTVNMDVDMDVDEQYDD